jgi:glycosyltransferase involved in cell wall biosynthesis
LLSFEKPDAPTEVLSEIRAQLDAAGIRWIPRLYHKSPTVPATAFDVSAGIATGLRVHLEERIHILHARSYVAAAMCLALKRLTGAAFIFDMRNFWADEKVDHGAWPRGGRLWRATKSMERRFLLAADQVVTLTHRAERELGTFEYLKGRTPPIAVIPTCVQLELFRRSAAAPPPGRAPKLVYSGSLGGRYQDAVIGRFFAAVQRLLPDATLEVWTRQDPAPILRGAIEAGAKESLIKTRRGRTTDVALALSQAHAGLSFLSDAYANRSSVPTKLGEYLASGAAVVTSPGIGDMDELLCDARTGVILETSDPTREQLDRAAATLARLLEDPGLPERARALAERVFSIDLGVDRYDQLYRRLGEG